MSAVHRDRYDDSLSTVSRRTDGGGKVKVTKYIVKQEDDAGSSYGRDNRSTYAPARSDDSRSTFRDDARRQEYGRGNARVVEDIRIVRKSREDDSPPPPRREMRYEPREERRETITIERDEVDRGRDNYWDRAEEVKDRELVISRTSGRDDRREIKGYGDYELVSRPRSAFEDRGVERIVRQAEYYAPPPPPQTIIIKQEPIIIRERVRDDDYQIVRRSEVEDDKSTVVSRRTREPRDEEYFYEKKVRERIAPRRDSVSPGDSISQVGRRNRRDSSDDSIVYVRKEKITETYGSEDDDDNHRGRDLAVGAAAGVAAAELIRSHKRKEAKETPSGVARLGVDVGAGAAGAAAAEVVRRIRSRSRAKGQSRDRSGDRAPRHGRRDSRPQSRGRSSSSEGPRDKLKTLGGIGLAAAAIAAGAAIANKKLGTGDDNSDRGRSRSRSRSRRRGYSRSRSRGSELSYLENDANARDDRNPKVRAAKIAGAGAVGAAATALLEHGLRKNQPKPQSRIKQGVPIALGALGTAALASVYENRKSKEEALDVLDHPGRRSSSRSRSRSRPRSRSRRGGSRSRSRGRRDSSTYYDDASRAAYDDPSMVSYGDRPLQGTIPGPGYYGQRAANEGYYNNSQRDLVPAAPATDNYHDSGARARDLSRTRARSLSSDSYNGSHSGRRGGARDAAAAAHANNQRDRRRRRHSRRDRSYTPEQQYYNNPHAEQNYGPADPYATQSGFHDPAVSSFPPPPGSMNYNPSPGSHGPPFPNTTYTPDHSMPGPSYGPQEYHPPPPPPPPAGTVPNTGPYTPGPDPYTQSQNRYTPRYGAADVSPLSAVHDQHPAAVDGVNRRSPDLHAPVADAPSSSAAKAYTPSTYDPATDNPLASSPSAADRGDARSEPRPGPNERSQDVRPDTKRDDLPYMPSPDLRPPSDNMIPSSPNVHAHRTATSRNDVPSMPNLFVPSPAHEERPRSSLSDTRVSAVLAPEEPRKSVSFNPQNEYQEAPTGRARAYSDPEVSNPDLSRPSQRKHEPGERSRLDDHERHRHEKPDTEFDTERDRDRRNRERTDQGRERAASHSGISNSSRHRQDRSPASDDSGETIDLPARFDDRGNRKSNSNGRTADQDLIADKIDELLGGKSAGVGKLFSSLLGGGSDSNSYGNSSKRDRDSRKRSSRRP